jgi:hypothetical protein
MALSGSLSDMGINDVLQLPFMGARTGELSIVRDGKTAHIYYHDGKIVHSRYGAMQDDEALAELLGWVTGDFTFKQGVQSPQETIKEDLHRLLMKVAKRRDEQQRQVAAPPAAKVSLESEEIRKVIQEATSAHPGFVLVSFVTRDGRSVNAVPAKSPLEPNSIAIAKQCFTVADAVPARGVKRCWLEYDDGHCLWLRLGSEISLLLMAQASVPMGAMMLAASKVGTALKQLVDGGETR